jgi:hypothetical protein
MVVENIKSKLEDVLETQLHLAVGNVDNLINKMPNVDVYRLAASCYRFINSLTQTYSDLLVEMIASPYHYKPATFFILDTKFLVWKAWLEAISGLYRFYMLDSSINGSLPGIVLDVTDASKELYEEMLNNKKDEFGETSILIEYFIKIHSKTYQFFRNRIEKIVSIKIHSELDAFNQIQKLAFEITKWMQYTTFEVLSLDRCLFGDKAVLIGASVITILQETGLNLVEEIKKLGIKDFELKFSSPDLAQYAYLFNSVKEVISDEIA